MPECHKCPFQKDFDSGKFDGLPFEQSPCHKCHWTGDQISNHGKTHISIDAGTSEQTLGAVEASIHQQDGNRQSSERYKHAAVAGPAIADALDRMTDAQRDVAIAMLSWPEESQEKIARRLKKTPQLVSSMFKVIRRIILATARERERRQEQ